MITVTKDLVSVVIPTHNRKELIARAINSALNQSYKLIEIIVVSDGSNDGTNELVKQMELEHDNLKLIDYFPGKGGNFARNTGIKASNGEFVAFLDDDDEWHSDKIEKQLSLLKHDSDIGIVCSAVNNVQDDTGAKTVFIPKAKYNSSREILLTNCIGSTTTVLLRRKILFEAGLFDENLRAMQDYDLWIRVCQITKVGLIEEPLVEYHNLISANQISWDYRKYAEAAELINKKYEMLRCKALGKKEMKIVRARSYLSVARKAFKTGDKRITRAYARKAFAVNHTLLPIIYIFASFLPKKIVYWMFTRTK